MSAKKHSFPVSVGNLEVQLLSGRPGSTSPYLLLEVLVEPVPQWWQTLL